MVVFLLSLLCVSVSLSPKFPLLQRTPLIGFRAYLNPERSQLNCITLQRLYFQMRSYSQVPDAGTAHIFWGDTIQPTPVALLRTFWNSLAFCLQDLVEYPPSQTQNTWQMLISSRLPDNNFPLFLIAMLSKILHHCLLDLRASSFISVLASLSHDFLSETCQTFTFFVKALGGSSGEPK